MITRNELQYIGLASLEARLLSKARPDGECVIWTGAKNDDGYGMIRLTKVNRGILKTIKVHQLSWLLHKSDIPAGLCVCHKCDKPACVNPEHLFLDTHAANMRDMVKKGRSAKGNKGMIGVNHPGAILDEALVIRARQAACSRGGLAALALETGIKYGTLWRAARRPWGEEHYHR